MSFWSSLNLVRCAAPPAAPGVTVASMSTFARRLLETGALAGGRPAQCRVKYGPRIDADERGMIEQSADSSGLLITHRERPWDRVESHPSVAALAQALEGDDGSVYRAELSLGPASPEIVAALTREPSAENSTGLRLSDVHLEVGPVMVSSLSSDAEAFVGWMSLSFSGPGYFFPWTFRSALERALRVEAIGRLADACRATWPVVPEPPSPQMIAARRELGALWLSDDLTLLGDWLWFASESG